MARLYSRAPRPLLAWQVHTYTGRSLMRTSKPLRHVLATGTAVALAAAVTWLPAGSASANVAVQYGALGSSNAEYVGSGVGGTCDLRAGDNESPSSAVKEFRDGTKRA